MRCSIALSVCASLLCACGGGGGTWDAGTDQPQFVTLTGAVSRSGTGSLGLGGQRRGGLGTLGLPGLGDGTTIDRVVAVPHHNGSVGMDQRELIQTVPLGADGSFSLELSTVHDWVILLEDSTAILEERVRAYVTVGDVQASLVNVPITRARSNVALGLLGGAGAEATSTATLDEAAQSFTLSLDTLKQMARMDDAFRNVINVYVNWNPETQVFYQITPQVIWTDWLERLVDGTSGPERYTFLGYGLWISSNDPRIDFAAGMDGTKPFRIVPPADVRVASGETFGPTNPMESSFEGRYIGGWVDEEKVTTSIVTPVAYNPDTAAAHFVDIVDGWWRLEQDGEVLALFQLGLAAPVDADLRPTGPVPQARALVDSRAIVGSFELDWVRWDPTAAAFVTVEVEPLEQLFAATRLHLTGLPQSLEGQVAERTMGSMDAPVLTGYTPTEQSWFTGSYADVPGGSALLTEVQALWESGGIEHQLIWYRPPCQDLDGDNRSYCQGDLDDKLPETSYCAFRSASGDPITENGTQYVPHASSYYGSVYFHGQCALAAGARPYLRVTYELAASDGTVVDTFETAPYVPFIKEYANAGAGDYTLTVTPWDALGNAYTTFVTHLRVLPFTDFFDAPAVKAELAGGGTQLLLTFNYWVDAAAGDCSGLLSDGGLRLLGATGCDTALTTNANCGGCGLACTGNEACKTIGFCYDDGGACTTPMKDCDANAGTGVNGCETDVTTSRLNCGACGRACAAGFDCYAGTCRPRCGPAEGDCDDNPATGTGGCETDLLASTANCGACGHACTGGATCVDGVCVNASDTCAPGFADCDGDSGTGVDGCEASLHEDDANCGACAHACGAQERCRGGACHPRCPSLVGDCVTPGVDPWLTVSCSFVGFDNLNQTYRFTWGGGPAPIAAGDRVQIRANAVGWMCEDNFFRQLPGRPDAKIPCPGFFPPLTTRVVGP